MTVQRDEKRGAFFYWRVALLVGAVASLCALLGAVALRVPHLAGLPGPLFPNANMAVPAAQVGRSSLLYILFAVVAPIVLALSYITVGAIIAWRQPDERGPLIFSLFLVAFGAIFALGAFAPEPVHSSVPLRFFVNASFMFLAVSCYLFPDGHLVPGWTRWTSIVWVYIAVVSTWFAGSAIDPNAFQGALGAMFWLSILGTCLVAQVYRYRYVSGPIQRQQTKWVALGLSVFLVTLILDTAHIPVPAHLIAWRQLVLGLLFMASLLLVPLTIAVAMLRYRLWDVDVLINRALVYGSLTVSLAALYLGVVIALEALMRALTNQSSDVAIAIATLVIAALFNPWRRRLQNFIDRRFYRRRYDAAQTLATFSSRLRDEVDLDHLTNHMLTVIQETIQPSSASIWLVDRGEKA